MQFHTENEILMYTYSYLHSRVFPTLLFMQYIPYCMTKLYITNDLIHPASVMLCLRINNLFPLSLLYNFIVFVCSSQ